MYPLKVFLSILITPLLLMTKVIYVSIQWHGSNKYSPFNNSDIAPFSVLHVTPSQSSKDDSQQTVPEDIRRYDRARQRKARLSNKVADDIHDSIGNLPLYQRLQSNKGNNTKKIGRPMTPLESRKIVWIFWHSKATPSTLTSQTGKLCVKGKPKLHKNLEFVDTVNIIKQRNHFFYESIWFVVQSTLHTLYNEFINIYPDHRVSFGTFYGLKPFYMRNVTEKDIEMCVCKKHLHACWAIQALLANANQQNMHVEFEDYDGFFSLITEECNAGEFTYLDWSCTPNKSEVCQDIENKWQKLK